MSGPTTAAGKIVRILDKNIYSILNVTKGPHWVINRNVCSRSQVVSMQRSNPRASGFSSQVPGYKPTNWDKKFLIWTGRFKKAEDIPETVSPDMLNAARSKMRVRVAYIMIALTLLGCFAAVVSGKQAARRHESLTSLNFEKKARWREEMPQSTSAKP
ncbi:protein FAM162A [Varanus komodoensis]|uniref:Family with sequence similarity 162 member A n=1 Tax=Varanus komodoensis TaxID=61221 RepID=A0A8D2ISD2_VARKO|nr:protein FAM162A [Varanus komodoensis]